MNDRDPGASSDSEQRLLRRLERERTARLEAEKIAERGLRELYEANRELDDRVRERTVQLESARREADLANAAKTKFLASLSHELRTPLNGVIGTLDLLGAFVEPGAGDPQVSPAQASQWLESAQASARRLNRIVVRLLRFIDIDALGDRPVSDREVVVPVPELLDRAAARWRIPCAKAGQLLSVELGSAGNTHVASPAEVMLAIDELLSNATEHAEPGSVGLRADVVGRHVRITVADSGPGLAERYQSRDLMAEPSDQAMHAGDGVSQQADNGAGLGLAIVRRVAEVLGGSSSVSTVDGTTSAWVEVPAAS